MMAQPQPEGQVTFEMSNLRPSTTNLPFVVWVSQRDDYQHDIRIKVGYTAKVFPSQMGSYSLRPFAFKGGQRLAAKDEALLERWIEKNESVLLAFWNADIEYSQDMTDQIKPL